MIKIWGDRSCHTPSPTNNFSFYLPSILRCFWKDSLMTSHPPPPHFKHLSLLPLLLPPPLLPNKHFVHTPSGFRVNEILTTLKQYFEGLRAIVNETNNNYQEFNPLQYGGGGGWGGHYCPPVGFSYAASKKVCNREMKLSDF